MLARLVFGLVLGLLMYVPRPTPTPTPPNDSTPPSPDELPPDSGDYVPPVDMPEIDPPGTPVPMPEADTPGTPVPMPEIEPPIGRRRPVPMPSVPPTPPPGYEGDWPPASERPDMPPTPPPGHDGPWPGAISFGERIRELINGMRGLLGNAGGEPKASADDAGKGARQLEV